MLTLTQVKKCVQKISEFTYVGYTRQIDFTGQIEYTLVRWDIHRYGVYM